MGSPGSPGSPALARTRRPSRLRRADRTARTRSAWARVGAEMLTDAQRAVLLTDAQRAVLLTDAQRAVLLARLRRGRDELAGAVPRRPAGAAELPASFGQEQLWFVDRFAPGLPTYNLPLAIAISGPLDTAALGQALDGLVSRHETLRTRLAIASGR